VRLVSYLALASNPNAIIPKKDGIHWNCDLQSFSQKEKDMYHQKPASAAVDHNNKFLQYNFKICQIYNSIAGKLCLVQR
jgi:hypothetical protein